MMRLKPWIAAAFLATSSMAFGAVTVSVRESGTGQSVINTTAGSTVNVDVIVTESGSGGLSGAQVDLVAGTTGILSVTGGSYNAAGWDEDIVNSVALPIVNGGIDTVLGPYGTGVDTPPLANATSTMMTLAIQVNALAPAGSYTLNANAASSIGCPVFPPAGPVPADIAVTADTALTINVGGGACTRTIVGRHVFYNNSFYDTASTACNNTFNGGQPCNDNSAVAPNVIALLPGQAPIVPPLGTQGVNSNYSSYTKGINGIMVDVQYAGCAALPAGPLTAPQIAATFEFVEGGRAVSNAFTGAVRVPTSATVAPHPTLANTDRITIIFADNSSTNSRWLRTRVLAGGAIDGLGAEDRFYFGLAKAEYMSVSSTNALTNNVDQGDAQSHPRSFLNRAPIDYSYDSNRDSLVNNVDQSEAQSNPTSFLNCLQLTGVAP